MSATIREARPDEIEALIPILLQAEESKSALRWSITTCPIPCTGWTTMGSLWALQRCSGTMSLTS
jgi:hypothetical protein